jgi:hypothetical protein
MLLLMFSVFCSSTSTELKLRNLTLEEIDERFNDFKHSDVPNPSAVMRGEADMYKTMEADVTEV